MNIVPLISMRKGRLLDGKDGDLISIDDLFKRIEKDTMLYILDFDGLEHNTPSLDVYQKLAEHCILWIDDGPRRLDDVMDIIMAGATNITLREELWPEMDIHDVLELTDDDVYVSIKSTYSQQSPAFSFSHQNIGVVVFSLEPQINEDLSSTSFFKDFTLKHKIYVYTVSQNTMSLWEGRGISGILIDLNKKIK